MSSVDPVLTSSNIKYTFSSRLIRLLIFTSGALFIFWAIFGSVFRNAENDFTGLVCVPISLGATCIIAGLAVWTEWQRAVFWFGLAIISQAVIFQITNAGSSLHYQHLKSVSEILHTSLPLLWGFLIVQAVFVFIGIGSRLKPIRNWLKTEFRLRQIVLIVFVFFICSATVSENVRFYVNELFLACILQTINLGNVILAAFAIPANAHKKLQSLFGRFFGNLGNETAIKSGMPDRFAVKAALFVVILAALLNVYSYERHPHVPDEVAYLMQARFFANGSLTMPAPPVSEAFEDFLMEVKGDRWYSVPPPGWALILAIGTLLGVPWLVNPILAGINLLLTYVLLRELYPKPVARVSIFLLCVSPWYVFLGMSFMTHMAALTCALLAALGVAWTRRKGEVVWAWAGGFALGFIFLIRPLEAVAAAGLLGLWAIGLGGKRLKLAGIAGLVFGSMLVGASGLFYNAQLTGNPLKFPIMEYTDAHFGVNSNAYGFGPDRGMSWSLDPNPGHSPFDALVNSNLNISTLNTELLGWSIGSFLLIAVFVFSGKYQRSDILMLAVIFAIYVLHFFYYYSGGPDFSARYWFLMVVPLIVLTVRGIQTLAEKLRNQSADTEFRLYVAVAALCFMTLINFIPWRAVDKYHNFRGMRPDIRYLADEYNFGRSLVLIQVQENKYQHDYDSAIIYNPLDFNADAPVYAWEHISADCVDWLNCIKTGDLERRKKLLEAYSDRPVWIIKSPSLTKRGFEVAAGPLNAEDLSKDGEQ